MAIKVLGFSVDPLPAPGSFLCVTRKENVDTMWPSAKGEKPLESTKSLSLF